jgi:hypothetical protein
VDTYRAWRHDDQEQSGSLRAGAIKQPFQPVIEEDHACTTSEPGRGQGEELVAILAVSCETIKKLQNKRALE